MTIYYDALGHLISDISLEELHDFAGRMGLKTTWFQNKPHQPHYDLTTANAVKRAKRAGAINVSPKEIVKKLKHAPYNCQHTALSKVQERNDCQL